MTEICEESVVGNAEKTILLVEDEPIVAESVESWLQVLGYQTKVASNGRHALDCVQSLDPDLVLMDVGLGEEIDGISAAQHMRELVDAPVVFLSGFADRQTIEKVARARASGFLLKPFTMKQLAVTVQLALCRHAEPDTPPSVLRVQDLEIDKARHRVSRSGSEIRLTKKEFQILACLAEADGAILSPETILAKAWGHQYVHYIQTVRVHVANLRQKIEPSPATPQYIETVPGVGYRLAGQGAN